MLKNVFSLILAVGLVCAGASFAWAVPDGEGNEVFPAVNVGVGTTAPQAKLEVGTATTVPAGSSPEAAIKGNLVVDGQLYGDGSKLTISIDNLTDVSTPAPVKDQVLKWNGTAWVPATYNASFTFSIATFSNTAGATTVEIGTGTWKSAGSFSFSASYNNGPATDGYVSMTGWSNLTLTGAGFVGPTATAQDVAYPGSVGGTRVFTLHATDGTTSPTSNSTFTFVNRRYWGVSSKTSSYTEADVEGLANYDLSNSTSRTFTVTAGPGEYIIFASRTALGTRTFTVGGFEGGFNAPETVSITNASGYTENYYVYRSVNANLGTTTVVVS